MPARSARPPRCMSLLRYTNRRGRWMSAVSRYGATTLTGRTDGPAKTPALWITVSTRPIRLTCSATSRVWDRSARSPTTGTAPRSTRSLTAARRSSLRACMSTWCPLSSKLCAVARPRPSAEPVTKMRGMGVLSPRLLPRGRGVIADLELRRSGRLRGQSGLVSRGGGRLGGGGDIGRRPAGQELETVLGRRAGFGGVDGQGQLPAVLGGQIEGVVNQLEEADGGMSELLGPGVVQPYVVRSPTGAELLADRGQLADELAQVLVVRVAAGLGAQQGDGDVGRGVPVGVVPAGPRVEELEAGDVGPPPWLVEHR